MIAYDNRYPGGQDQRPGRPAYHHRTQALIQAVLEGPSTSQWIQQEEIQFIGRSRRYLLGFDRTMREKEREQP